jgi:hypothetical protein
MTALEAIRDNLNMLEMTAGAKQRGNDLALIERIRRDLTYLRGYDEVEEFIPAEEADEEETAAEPTPITPSAQDSVKTDEVKSEEGSAQRASKFDTAQ